MELILRNCAISTDSYDPINKSINQYILQLH